jgi:hypothetical protein|tara:strand:+ start:967 stop:1455 length:489 start_codon:yes stop_codon:yes gene_type:complete
MPDLHWQEVTNEQGDKGLFVSTDVAREHTIAEGIIAEYISEVKTALDALWEAVEGENHELVGKLMEPTYHMVRYDLETKLEVLESFKRQSIRPKHRDCRVIMKHASSRLAANSPLLESRQFDPGSFIKDTIRLVKDLHTCLLEQTKKRERVEIRNEYTRQAA